MNAPLEKDLGDIQEGSRRINLLSLSLSLSLWIHEFSINVEILPLLGPLLESSDDDKEKAPGRPGEFAIESRK